MEEKNINLNIGDEFNIYSIKDKLTIIDITKICWICKNSKGKIYRVYKDNSLIKN